MINSSKRHWDRYRCLDKSFLPNFILPTKRLIMVCALGALVIPFGFLLQFGFSLFWMYNALLLLVSIMDLARLPRRHQLTATRRMPEHADLFHPFEVTLHIENRSGKPISFTVTDDVPATFSDIAPVVGKMTDPTAVVSYQTKGKERGRYTFFTIYFRYSGGFRLWQKQQKIPYEQEIRIFPDLSGVRGILASLPNSLILEGRKIRKRENRGSELAAIRDYVPGDDPRHLNWAATARSGHLKTNVLQPEQGKIVTILLDCGRMMGVELENRVKLDRTLEAALILAAVALGQGDQVAILAFSSGIKVYLPPAKGMSHLHAIIQAVYDLKSDFVESNYAQALDYIRRVQKKRSLLVLLSDMESYLFEESLFPYLMRMRRSHLFLLLSLHDPLLAQWVDTTPGDTHTAFVKSVAQKFTLDRLEYVQKMAGIGVPVLDVSVDRLALAAVNYYLELRSKEAL